MECSWQTATHPINWSSKGISLDLFGHPNLEYIFAQVAVTLDSFSLITLSTETMIGVLPDTYCKLPLPPRYELLPPSFVDALPRSPEVVPLTTHKHPYTKNTFVEIAPHPDKKEEFVEYCHTTQMYQLQGKLLKLCDNVPTNVPYQKGFL